jgi:hypothetical protein
MPALFNCCCIGTYIQHSHKREGVSGQKPSPCICQDRSDALWSCAHFTWPNTITFQENTACAWFLLNMFSEPPPLCLHILHTCQWGNSPYGHIWCLNTLNNLLMSNTTILAHTFRTGCKSGWELGSTLSCCIPCTNALCSLPTSHNVFPITSQEIASHSKAILLHTLKVFSMLPTFCIQARHRPLTPSLIRWNMQALGVQRKIKSHDIHT